MHVYRKCWGEDIDVILYFVNIIYFWNLGHKLGVMPLNFLQLFPYNLKPSHAFLLLKATLISYREFWEKETKDNQKNKVSQPVIPS